MISLDIHGNKYKVNESDLTWRPSSYGIVVCDSHILLTIEDGRYHLPGGGIELSETPEEGLIREIKEETGITVTSPRLVDINSSYFTWENHGQPGSFSHVKGLLLYFVCELGGVFDEPSLDEYEKAAGLQAEWVDIARINEIVIGTTVDWRDIVKRAISS